jgi:hypothetical protein
VKKLKICYAICLALVLVAFSMSWYPTSVPVMKEHKFQKMLPSPLSEYAIGSAPYTGWDVFPFTAPAVIGFLLALVVLFTKRRVFALALAAGILMFVGILAGLACAPSVISTWVGTEHIYGTGSLLLGNGWYFSFVMSLVLLIVPFVPRKMGWTMQAGTDH